MKKSIIRVLALVLVVFMVLSICACGSETEKPSDDTGKKTSDTEKADDKTSDTEKTDDSEKTPEKNPTAKADLKLKAEKIGTISGDLEIRSGDSGWLYQDENGHFGLLTLDGKKDTGAKYTAIESMDIYYKFSTCEDEVDYEDPASLNIFGLMDVEGNVIIPEEYAAIKMINDGFAIVCKVEEKVAYDDPKMMIFFSDSYFPSEPAEGDACYIGSEEVYSISERKSIYQENGEIDASSWGDKDIVCITDKDGTDLYYNGKGDIIDDEINFIDVFDNGTYKIDKNDKTTVKDAYGKELFTYKNTSYDIDFYDKFSDCYIANSAKDHAFIIIGTDGKELTEEIGNEWDYDSFCGESVLCKYVDDDSDVHYLLCDTKGNKLIDEEFDHGAYNEFADIIFLYNEDGRIVIAMPDGSIIADVNSGNDYVDTIMGCIDNDENYLCYKDGKFSISGSDAGYFTVCDDDYRIIDLFTGDVLFEDFQPYKGPVFFDDVFYAIGTDAAGDFVVYSIAMDK